MPWKQIGQFPPAFIISVIVASVIGMSIILPSPRLLQQQQYKHNPKHNRGKSATTIRTRMTKSQLKKTMAAYTERITIKQVSIGIVAIVTMAQMITAMDRSEKVYYPLRTHLILFQIIDFIDILVILRRIFLASYPRSGYLSILSAENIIELVHSSKLPSPVKPYPATA